MCGLCGILGPGISKVDLDIMQNLLYVSALRGQHGTGLLQAKVTKWGKDEPEILIEKRPWNSNYFMYYHKYHTDGNREVINDVHDHVIAGHCRAATVGDVNIENTHPFEFSNIVGMHNGTMKDDKYVNDPSKTDSELFLKDINERGLKTVLEDIDPESAYALMIFDKRTKEVSFVNNGKREIYIGINKHRGVIYWASEEDIIRLCVNRHKAELIDDEVKLLKPYIVFSTIPNRIPIGKKELWTCTTIIPKAKKKSEAWTYWPKPERGQTDVKPRVRVNSFRVKDKVPVAQCCACHKDMLPIDCFYGMKISFDTYVCEECQTNDNTTEVKVG